VFPGKLDVLASPLITRNLS